MLAGSGGKGNWFVLTSLGRLGAHMVRAEERLAYRIVASKVLTRSLACYTVNHIESAHHSSSCVTI